MKSLSHVRLAPRALLLALLASGSTYLYAQTWDGGGPDNNWGAANNWNPDSVPGSGSSITFAGSTRPNVSVPWWIDAASITFASGAGAFTLTDGGLRIGSGGLVGNSANTQTINISSIELTADQTWIANAGALVIGAGNFDGGKKDLSLQGNGSITVNRAISEINNLTLSGSGARTFGAAVTIRDTLTSTNTGAVGFSGAVSVKRDISLGGSAAYTASSTITSDNGNIVINSGSASSFAGTVTATNGSVTVSSSGATTFGGSVVGKDAVSFVGSGNSTVAGYLASSNGAVTLSGAGNVTAGSINSAGGGVVFSGTGNRTINGAVNTAAGFTVTGSGATTITGSINAGTTAVSIGGSGTVTITGSGSTINAGSVTISGSVNTTFDTQINSSGGAFTQSGTGTTTFTGTGSNFFSSVNVTGGNLVMEQSGGAAIQTNGMVNISNATVTFSLGANNQISNWTDVTLGNGAALYLNNTTQSIDQLVINGNAIIDFGTGGSTLDINSISFNSGSTLTVINWNNTVDHFYADLAPGSSLPQVIFADSGSAGTWGSGSISPGAPVPEPSTYGFVAVGALCFTAAWRRRRVRA